MPRRGENIYRRKDGLWEARYVKEVDLTGKKKYGSVYARTYREVKIKRQDALDRIFLYQKPQSIRNMTISELVEEWLYINRSRVKLSTHQRYQGFFENHIKNNIGSLPVIYFNPVAIREFAAERRNTGLSGQTVNSVLIFLHACLKYGHRQYQLPLPEFTYFPAEPKEMRVFSQEEQSRLVDYLKHDIDHYKFGVLMALYTGVRVGELCALHWDDIEDDCINIRRTMIRLKKATGTGTEIVVGPPKTKASRRTIPLLSLLKALTYELKTSNQNQLYILGTASKPIVEPRAMQYHFQKYMKAVDIEGASFHTLRHTFATRSIEAGMDVKTLTELLGHSNVQTTLNLYVHSSMELKRSSVERLGLFF